MVGRTIQMGDGTARFAKEQCPGCVIPRERPPVEGEMPATQSHQGIFETRASRRRMNCSDGAAQPIDDSATVRREEGLADDPFEFA